jgi:hypothetical protein
MAVMIASGGISAAVLANWTLRAGLTRSIATGVKGLFYPHTSKSIPVNNPCGFYMHGTSELFTFILPDFMPALLPPFFTMSTVYCI